MSVGEDMYECYFKEFLESPLFTSSNLSMMEDTSFTPNLEGNPAEPNFITKDYFSGDPNHVKDTVTSATTQVGEQANNDLRLSLECTKSAEPATATATANTDRSSPNTSPNEFVLGVLGSDCPGQPGISECDVAPTPNKGGGGEDNNNNNLPVPSTVPVASAITDKPEIRKRGRPTGGSSTISLEQLQQQFGKTLQEAANSFVVSVSTLKRVARGYAISPWPGPKKKIRVVKKASSSPRNYTTSSEPDPPPPAAELAMQDATRITFKAYFGALSILIFELPSTLKMVDVQQQVAKRLNIKMGSFSISYRNEDGGEWALITCDDDLLRVLRWTTVQILVEPITKLMALTSKYK